MADKKNKKKDVISEMILDGVPLLSPVDPDSQLMRRKEAGRFSDHRLVGGTAHNFNNGCPHPLSAIRAFYDDRTNTSVNLFKCDACSGLLWLVDGSGKAASDR